MALARVVVHMLARAVPHVLARVLLHVLARVIIHVHDYYLKTCLPDRHWRARADYITTARALCPLPTVAFLMLLHTSDAQNWPLLSEWRVMISGLSTEKKTDGAGVT